jgi:hypothetical protein
MLAVCAGVALPAAPVTLRSDVQTMLRADIHVSVVLGPGETFDTTVEGPPEGTQDSIEAFGLRWGKVLEVSTEGRRASMRSTAAPLCDSGLLRRIAINADGTPPELLFAIAKAAGADPSLAALPPPGLVSGGGDPPASPELTAKRITLTGKAVPIARALDLVTESTSGLGWWAAESCSAGTCACRIGLITPDSVVTTSYDIARKASTPPK